jgi:hypothetical protein
MKRQFIILLILGCNTFVGSAQFRGGQQDGNGQHYAFGLNSLPAIYFGGISDGIHAFQVFGLNQLPDFTKGGSNDGFASVMADGLNPLPEIYSGASNDGFQTTFAEDLNLLPAIFSGGTGDGFDDVLAQGLNVLPEIYSGGLNDGMDIVSRSNNNLPCNDDLFVWTGAVNEQWNEPGNWECYVAPGIFSGVIIPEGVLSNNRPYPIVYLEAEVSKVTLRSGAYLQIEPGVILKLNGN